MLTAKEIRLILIAPAVIAIIVLSGCFNKKENDKKTAEETKITKTDGTTKSVIEIEEIDEEEDEEDEVGEIYEVEEEEEEKYNSSY